MKIRSIIPAIACMAGLAGCAQPETLSPDFGNAMRHNMAIQIVNPEPDHGTEMPGLAGSRGAEAYGRYRAGKVKEPVPVSTKQSGSSAK